MKQDDELTVTIEGFSNLGYGIARDNGFVIFVENSCPQDVVKIKLTKVTKNYANADVIEIITPSPHRVKPFCAMQKVCGACQLQFIDYDYQLELKRQITEEAMHHIAGLNIEVPLTIASPQIKEYRHKVQYPVAETKVSKRLLAGYYKQKTHEIVNIKHCPIQPAICDKIIEFIRENAPKYCVSGYNEKKHTGDLRHVVLRCSTSTGKVLVTLVVNSTKVFENLKKFANIIYEQIPQVVGVCINFNPQKTNVILGEKSECICGEDVVEEKILDKTFKIGSNTFFQVNPKSAENIFRYVKDYIKNNLQDAVVLDAYAGVTSFGICISDVCKQIVSIEENSESVRLGEKIAKENGITNIEFHSGDAAEFFKNETRKFDAVILDPPRKGCTKESLDEAFRLSKGTIIYVSCNPATLARDLKILTEKGCCVESIQPFDMFCHTYHVENVAIIRVCQPSQPV